MRGGSPGRGPAAGLNSPVSGRGGWQALLDIKDKPKREQLREYFARVLLVLVDVKGQNGRFTVEIVDDDVRVERIHRLLHTWWQLAVRLVPTPLDMRDHILRIMGPGKAYSSQMARRSAGVIKGQTFLRGVFGITCSICHSLGVKGHHSAWRGQARENVPDICRTETIAVNGPRPQAQACTAGPSAAVLPSAAAMISSIERTLSPRPAPFIDGLLECLRFILLRLEEIMRASPSLGRVPDQIQVFTRRRHLLYTFEPS